MLSVAVDNLFPLTNNLLNFYLNDTMNYASEGKKCLRNIQQEARERMIKRSQAESTPERELKQLQNREREKKKETSRKPTFRKS